MFANLPLNALRTFESAARLGSFKAASAELHVTPTAISHQVRLLEEMLGAALFERLPRRVTLTAAGHGLHMKVHEALLEINQAVAALRASQAHDALTVSTTHSFAALWLVPRLGGFRDRHPASEVRLQGSANVVDLLVDRSIDVAIRYDAGATPGLLTAGFLDETFGVYGAPALLKTVAGNANSAPPLISVTWKDSQRYAAGWQAWCKAARLAWLDGAATLDFPEEHYALQAAIAGQGLLLGSSVMVADSVGAGLLQAYRPRVRVAGGRYSVLCVPGRERHPPVQAFLDWIQAQDGVMPGRA